MDLNLQGKNALVCGSSKGIGKASAQELAKLGANVTLVARSGNIMAGIIRQLDQTNGQQHDFLVVDFSRVADLKQKAAGLTATKNIHILVNNTGGPPAGPIVNAQEQEFIQAFYNHLICNHVLSKAVIKGMKADGYGRIINIVSTSVKEPIPGLGVSNTIRGAVGNWAKTMANELGPYGITVNNVLPGAANTERLRSIFQNRAEAQNLSVEEVQKKMEATIPMGRIATPSEIAAAVAFLSSPAASYITGINLPVDGGRTKSH